MGCTRFGSSVAELWPDLSSRPELADHVRQCPECAATVRVQARMANLLEGIGANPSPTRELAEKIKETGRKARRVAPSRFSVPALVVVLAMIALMGRWHRPAVGPTGVERSGLARGEPVGLVDARMVKEQGVMVLDKAISAMEPLTLATKSAISRVLYEVAEPILVINRS